MIALHWLKSSGIKCLCLDRASRHLMIPRIAGVASRLLVTSRRQYSSSVPSSLIDTSGLTESTIAQLSTSPPPLILLPSFVTEKEQSALVIQSQRRLKRILGRKGYARYEPGHFDNVIRNYKEAIISDWGSDLESAICRDIVERIKASVNLPPETVWLDSHILDLASDGEILSHVDHAGYSGGVIAGLSLVSPCVMHFQRKQEHFSILLEPGSLYIQR